jgi:murein L,D-transpeptidase YafK
MTLNVIKIVPYNCPVTKKIFRFIILELMFQPAVIFYGCTSPKTSYKNADSSVYDSLSIHVPAGQHSLERFKNYYLGLPELMQARHNNKKMLHLEIDKSNYMLSVMDDSSLIKQYPVVFGHNPSDDKLQQGDGCTPEGNFKVRAKYPHRFWSRFIWLDYPNSESMRKIRVAKMAGLIPSNADPGGEIGIHGVISGCDFMVDYRQNWTAGCISMKNHDVRELFEYIDSGTVVIIRK